MKIEGASLGSARISAVLYERLRRLPLIVTTLSTIDYPFCLHETLKHLTSGGDICL
jgi:hypothetical protein